MEGVCVDCGQDGKLHARGRCTACYWRAKHDAAKEVCPGCGERWRLRPTPQGPRCHRCIRRARPRKQPTPRRCRRCGQVRRHAAHGLCNACYQRDPVRVGVWVQGADERLGERCPDWFGAFAGWLLDRSATGVSLRHLRRLERALTAGVERPAALIAAVSDGGRSGRSPGDTARLLEAFLVDRGLVLASDERGRLAHGRRARRIERCPQPLRPAAERYAAWLLTGRERARRIGEQPLTDHTIEQRLAVLAALAARLDRDGVRDWATCSRAHIEAFLATGRDRGFRLAALRDFFHFARQQRICLTDPTDRARPPTRPRLPRPHAHPGRPGTAAAPLGSRRLSPARGARRTARAAARRRGQRAAPAHHQRRQHRNENRAARPPTAPGAA